VNFDGAIEVKIRQFFTGLFADSIVVAVTLATASATALRLSPRNSAPRPLRKAAGGPESRLTAKLTKMNIRFVIILLLYVIRSQYEQQLIVAFVLFHEFFGVFRLSGIPSCTPSLTVTHRCSVSICVQHIRITSFEYWKARCDTDSITEVQTGSVVAQLRNIRNPSDRLSLLRFMLHL